MLTSDTLGPQLMLDAGVHELKDETYYAILRDNNITNFDMVWSEAKQRFFHASGHDLVGICVKEVVCFTKMKQIARILMLDWKRGETND